MRLIHATKGLSCGPEMDPMHLYMTYIGGLTVYPPKLKPTEIKYRYPLNDIIMW